MTPPTGCFWLVDGEIGMKQEGGVGLPLFLGCNWELLSEPLKSMGQRHQ